MQVFLPSVRDWIAPVALAALTVIDALVSGTTAFPRPVWLVAVVVVAASLVLLWRRRCPAATTIISAALVTAYLLFLHVDLRQQPALEPFLVLVLAFFSLGLHASHRSLLVGAFVSAALVLSAQGLALAAGRPVGEVFPSVLFWVAAGAVGRLLHHRHHETRLATERAERALQEREWHARAAVAEERARIARELHDVIAHSLSVIVIHASVEARLHRDPQGSTATAFHIIESTGREALAELRRLLGLLRSDESMGEPLQPLPSVRNLDGLMNELRQAGLRVSVHRSGQPRDLAPGVDLSVYRIVQEALTNAFKHAPGATVTVNVNYLEDSVSVAVEDDGATRQSFPTLPGSGHGLIGMRERVKLYDGQLEAGPSDSGGFSVKASIPAPAERQ